MFANVSKHSLALYAHGQIPQMNIDAPWNDDLDHVSLQKLKFKSVGGFGETAFFHRQSGTLLVTDAVVKIEDDAPPIIQEV